MDLKKIEELEAKIKFWNRKLLSSKNEVEIAVLNDKISQAKKEIEQLKEKKQKQHIKQHIDAPAVVDRKSNDMIELSRGQIMNSGDVFGMQI